MNVCTERVCVTVDGRFVRESDPQAAFLAAPVGAPLPPGFTGFDDNAPRPPTKAPGKAVGEVPPPAEPAAGQDDQGDQANSVEVPQGTPVGEAGPETVLTPAGSTVRPARKK